MQENIFEQILKGEFADPHSVLGLQNIDENKRVIRIFRPDSENCELEVHGRTVLANKIHDAGFYEYEVAPDFKPTDYRIFHTGGKLAHDPYAFELTFGQLDIHLLNQGLHYELYDLLGATIKVHQGVMGTNFAVWAPNAVNVSIVGDFNHWNGKATPMRSVGETGVWEIFLPGLGEGENYKFEILTKNGERLIKTDPVAHFFALRPDTSSIVFDVSRFHWSDAHYLEERKKIRDGNQPINVYEVHPGAWKRKDGAFLNYRELAEELSAYCKEMHFTHVELMGICEHPLDESWGYQVTGYFGPTSRYGTPEDFQYLVSYLHEHDIGVILDWVPAHFPTDAHSLFQFDGTYLYEHEDPRQGYHPHWNTHIFNYGRWEVSNFLIASALFWIQKMHIDGLRVDAVASMLYLDYGREAGEWVPNVHGTNINLEAVEFLKHLNSIIHKHAPDVLTIAEESTDFAGITKDVDQDGLGFDLKWNLGWMHDTLAFFEESHNLPSLNHIMDYAFREKFILVLSHDEVVHGKKSLLSKMPGSEEQKVCQFAIASFFYVLHARQKTSLYGGRNWSAH